MASDTILKMLGTISSRSVFGLVVCALVLLTVGLTANTASTSFDFVILGDRTGETQDHVYEQVWSEIKTEQPAFVLSVGDSIQGLDDSTAEKEWKSLFQILASYRRIPLYLTPGNHDVWSEQSEAMFRKYSRHAVHYGFDYRQVHVTVLDNSRSEQLSPGELRFFEDDLKAHAPQPVKLIVSHRPSVAAPGAVCKPEFSTASDR